MILASPTLLGRTSTLTLGTIIEHGKLVFLMSLTHLPRHNFLDFDYVVVASRTHIVVVVEGNHVCILSDLLLFVKPYSLAHLKIVVRDTLSFFVSSI
jgi:hypothetical protein